MNKFDKLSRKNHSTAVVVPLPDARREESPYFFAPVEISSDYFGFILGENYHLTSCWSDPTLEKVDYLRLSKNWFWPSAAPKKLSSVHFIKRGEFNAARTDNGLLPVLNQKCYLLFEVSAEQHYALQKMFASPRRMRRGAEEVIQQLLKERELTHWEEGFADSNKGLSGKTLAELLPNYANQVQAWYKQGDRLRA